MKVRGEEGGEVERAQRGRGERRGKPTLSICLVLSIARSVFALSVVTRVVLSALP